MPDNITSDDISIGDILVVPAYGPCTITAIEAKELYGSRDTFVTLAPHCDNETSTTTIPMQKFTAHGVRWPANPGRMLEVLECLRDNRCKFSGNSNKRGVHFRNLMQSRDPRELARCVRDLWTPEGSERSYLYMDLYDPALERLAREVAIVFWVPLQGVRGSLESIITNRTPPEDIFGSQKKP